MRFFFDTEFIESGPNNPLQLASIGIVAEDGLSYYAVVDRAELRIELADNWFLKNVLPKLDFDSAISRSTIASELSRFVGEAPEFWGYYCSYDWVLLCQLYGRMTNLPKSWPRFCLDVKQLAASLGNPPLPCIVTNETEHHALYDSQEVQVRYKFLMQLARETTKK